MNKSTPSPCDLCDSSADESLWQDELCRVILVENRDYPGFLRVIVNRHIKEMTDLDMQAGLRLMQVVFAAERALRLVLRPEKINLASLGNVAPHLHWHVIARFVDDKHFPDSIWAEARRAGSPRYVDRQALRHALLDALKATRP